MIASALKTLLISPAYGYRQEVRARLTKAFAFALLILFGLAIYLFWQVRSEAWDYWRELWSGPVAPAPTVSHAAEPTRYRSEIHDRQGQVLATTVEARVLCADWRKLASVEATVAGIMEVLPQADAAWLRARLARGQGSNWLRYRLSERERDALIARGVAGITFCKVPERFYPLAGLSAHWLGTVEPDLSQGHSGIERAFNAEIRSRRSPLVLTLEAHIQHSLVQALAASIDTFEAKSGYGVLLDASNGEVLAMASLPLFDPQIATAADDPRRFFSPMMGRYEHGSVMKLFTFAAALDLDLVTLSDRFDVTPPQTFNQVEVNDYAPYAGILSLKECLQRSSNICSSQVAIRLGIEAQQRYYRAFGLSDALKVQFGEAITPTLPQPWLPSTLVTQSFGYGVATSPLHVAAAGAALVNGGLYYDPQLVRDPSANPAPGRRVLRPETSRLMRELMALDATGGSGRLAMVEGIQVGGKTGTANKVGAQGYTEDRRLSSFLGVFPLDNPRYVLLIGIDEPKPLEENGYATGGRVAAPVFAEVVTRILPHLGITPDPDWLDQQLAAEQQALDSPETAALR